jgi:DNA-binding GntR family transcriptional regulator
MNHGSAKIDKRGLVDQIYEYLLDQIISGNIAYSEALDIRKLAVDFEVSPMPVREALKRLEYDRIVDIKPRSSCKVKHPTKTEISEIYELREVLEIQAAKSFLANYDVTKLKRLRNITSEMNALDKLKNTISRRKKAIELDRLFHTELCKLANNSYLSNYHRQISLYVNMALIHEKSYTPLRDVFFKGHADIVNFLEKKSSEVFKELRSHFQNTRVYLCK